MGGFVPGKPPEGSPCSQLLCPWVWAAVPGPEACGQHGPEGGLPEVYLGTTRGKAVFQSCQGYLCPGAFPYHLAHPTVATRPRFYLLLHSQGLPGLLPIPIHRETTECDAHL